MGSDPSLDIAARLALADALLGDGDPWVVFRPVTDASGAAVDFQYLLSNPASDASAGLGPLVGHRLLELIPEARDGVFGVFHEVHATGHRRSVEFANIVRRSDQPWQPGWTTLDVWSSAGLLVVRWRDSTDDHVAAMTSAKAEARLAALLANAGEVISVWAPDGSIAVYQSPSLQRMLGRPRFEPRLGTDVHPDDRAAVEEEFARVAAGGPGAVGEVEFRMQHADGQWLWVHGRGTNFVDDPDVGGVVVNMWDITERRALADQLRLQALHDPLTGLPNRRLVDDELRRALARLHRTPGCVGLVLCDVDYFKSVNDALGHPAGDDLLVQVAQRLRAVVRPADTVGRLGGDEFVVLCEDLHDRAELTTLTTRLQAAVRGVYRVGGQDLPVTVTVGGSCATSPVAETRLLSEADTALYEAKRAGRDCSQVFDQRVHRRERQRATRQQALRTAVEQNELVLHYQPKIELHTGLPVAAEALVRWQHPTDGLLPPSEFLPTAEESLLVVDVGEWVLRTAMADAARWLPSLDAPLGTPLPRVNINISGRHLTHPGLLGHLERALTESGLDPARVELEITETVLLRDLDLAGQILGKVRDRGFTVALDDFGTGYSSLTWLQRLPVDTVKLDRSFIADLLAPGGGHAPDILGSVTSLAHALGKRVVAEGVETREQHDYVVGLGCDLAQGYLYGRPAAGSPFPLAAAAAPRPADGAAPPTDLATA